MSAEPTKWMGVCDVCGTYAPEERDSWSEANTDARECPCREGE